MTQVSRGDNLTIKKPYKSLNATLTVPTRYFFLFTNLLTHIVNVQQRWNKPAIIVELLSPGTEDEDPGRSNKKQGRPPTKWEVYEKRLNVPYYVVFSRYTNELRAFELIRNKYVEMIPVDNRLWFRKLKLGLGLWNGTWDGHEGLWLRWYNIENKFSLFYICSAIYPNITEWG